jgi:hypothetical protein
MRFILGVVPLGLYHSSVNSYRLSAISYQLSALVILSVSVVASGSEK